MKFVVSAGDQSSIGDSRVVIEFFFQLIVHGHDEGFGIEFDLPSPIAMWSNSGTNKCQSLRSSRAFYRHRFSNSTGVEREYRRGQLCSILHRELRLRRRESERVKREQRERERKVKKPFKNSISVGLIFRSATHSLKRSVSRASTSLSIDF
jgi:hypothetical protein